jgi:hypothetical protein
MRVLITGFKLFKFNSAMYESTRETMHLINQVFSEQVVARADAVQLVRPLA